MPLAHAVQLVHAVHSPSHRPSRRRLLAGGGALAAAGLLAACGTPRMGAPATATVAPGVVRVPVGAFTVTSIVDGRNTFPLAEGFVRNAPLAQVQAALREANLPTDTLTITFTGFVVDTGSARVLMDTGNGQFGGPNSGQLLANMSAAGIDPKSITDIAITHFHGDHIGGIRNRDGTLAFPAARIWVPAPEYDFWMDDAQMSARPQMRAAFENVRRVFGPLSRDAVRRFLPSQEILPGIGTLPAYGHTPGHTAFVVQSRGERLAYLGDLTNVPALFVRNPDWAVQFDMFPDEARETRRRILDQAVRDDWLVAGFHWGSPGIGRIVRRGNGFDFVPLANPA